MNFKKLYSTTVFILISILCFSQSVDSVHFVSKTSNLKLSYNSSLIYPGVRTGIELPIKTMYITKVKKSGSTKVLAKDQFITANISWYHHPNFHDNIYLTSGWTTRRTKSKGFFTEFSPEIGLSRTFLGGTTYKVDNNGKVTIERLAGYYYAFVSIGGGLGYDFSKTKSKPFMVFSKFNLFAMFPYNSTIYLRPAAEFGLIYTPQHFLVLKVRSRNIKKNI